MEKYILAEYLTSLNNAIPETFKSTQRFKLTAFDISNNLILFGASSGGIYVFRRNPYEFLKLIPSKEGAVNRISISSNEKYLAVSSTNGVITILENFITDTNVQPLTYYEHEGNIVNVLKWHGNNVYCGDNLGRISVCTLTTLLAKAIFQTPSAVLMKLDSAIVQIDTYRYYLLISTKTRTYLCDTEREQYKQIGKKLRDGNFGACFLNTDNGEFIQPEEKSIGVFRTITEDESFPNVLDTKSKIYCARPGLRLWEANFEADVLVTHQFRDCLDQNISELLIVDDNCDAKLNAINCDQVDFPKNFNFGTILPVNQRFVFTYDNNGIYFFDPLNGRLAYWTNVFHNFRDIKILDNYIYIWRKDFRIITVALQSLEELTLTTLLMKQYFLCAQICIRYITDIINLIDTSKKIHLISVLKTTLHEQDGINLLEEMMPIFCKLEEYKTKHYGQKLDRCIVAVENGYLPDNMNEEYIPESVKTFTGTNSKNGNYKEVNNKILYKQYILNKSHAYAELTETNRLLDSLNLNEVVPLFDEFIDFVKEKNGECAKGWCQGQLLKRASKECIDITSLDPATLTYLDESYLGMNKFQNLNCKCNFPLPSGHKMKPDYYQLGCMLMDHTNKDSEYLYKIPYLYKHKLKCINTLSEINSHLPIILQFSDKEIFKKCLRKFTYDTWDEMLKLFIKLKQSCCLNCGSKISTQGLISWQNFALLMVESIGPRNACRLLIRYTSHIPNGDLDATFYQSCILANVHDSLSIVTNFMDTVGASNSRFEESLEKFLRKKYIEKEASSDCSIMPINAAVCTFCLLPLGGPILTETKKTACQHDFHALCYNYFNGCNVCNKNS